MFVKIDDMPKSSRVWIYQANRELNDEEAEWLGNISFSFCEQWKAHGQDLKTSFDIRHGRFLILAVDEGTGLPSGCSIDSSIRLVTDAQKQLGVDFFDRTQVAYLENGSVRVLGIPDFKEKIKSGEITGDTKVFNNLVTNLVELEEAWLTPAAKTWLKKYFNVKLSY